MPTQSNGKTKLDGPPRLFFNKFEAKFEFRSDRVGMLYTFKKSMTKKAAPAGQPITDIVSPFYGTIYLSRSKNTSTGLDEPVKPKFTCLEIGKPY